MRSETTADPAQGTMVASAGSGSQRWVQLVMGIVCMAMVANLQYGWTIFVDPIDAKYQWGRAAIQVAFSLFIVFETWMVPFEAYLADRFGPRPLVLAGAVLVAISWITYSRADTLRMLYAGGVIGGVGAALVYGTCIGNAVKWFEKRRGLAAGLTSAGYGAGAAITVVPLTRSLAAEGYEATFFTFALIQGALVLLAGVFLKKPPSAGAPRAVNPRVLQSKIESSPVQTLRSPLFWLMYAVFVMVAASGLFITAQVASLATSFGIARSPVTLAVWTIPALTLALSLNNMMNGVGRPLFGWISDVMGREITLCIIFLMGGSAILSLGAFGSHPAAFVVLTASVFLAWDIYSIFPALTSDHFGRKYATTNYAMLYTAKGTAALFVPFGSLLATQTGSWEASLLVAGTLQLVAAILTMAVMRPLRMRELRSQGVFAPASQ
jgi:MFS transporter, OFA family, oxalate/formate antiporter